MTLQSSLAAFSSVFPIPERTGLLSHSERTRQPARFGDIAGPQLSNILRLLDRGQPEAFADLVEFALSTDPLLISLNTTRVTRVTQAEYQIIPSEYGDPHLAQLAAEFIDEAIGRVENWRDFLKGALHAIPLGYSAHEIEWDEDTWTGSNWIRRLHYVNPNRFRYDRQWRLRLYDHGHWSRTRIDQEGEALLPSKWVVHTHQEMAGLPNVYGVFRSIAYYWMFHRWSDRFWLRYVEKYGSPRAHAEIPANTPAATRNAIKQGLIEFASDGIAVIEGGKLVIESQTATSGSNSQHELFQNYLIRQITAAYLGTSDAAAPGENGSQAAVSTRTSSTMDPRMVADGLSLCDTLKSSVFAWLIHFNLHKFGGVPPLPSMAFKTASDEAKVDGQDYIQQQIDDGENTPVASPYEIRGEIVNEDDSDPVAPLEGDGVDDAEFEPAQAGEPTQPGTPPPPSPLVTEPSGVAAPGAAAVAGEIKAADTALNGAQVSSLLEIIGQVVDGRLPRASAVSIMQVAFNLPLQTAEALLGEVGKSFTPTEEPAAPAPQFGGGPPNPKGLSRSNQGRRQVAASTKTRKRSVSAKKTSLTGLRSTGALGDALVGKLVDRLR